jgi:hypothetical protein
MHSEGFRNVGEALRESRGIYGAEPFLAHFFLTYTCEDCHDCKMAEYLPDVLTDPSYWTCEPIDEE